MKIRILTYNIHKGFSIGNRRFILDSIKKSIVSSNADLVHLQEVGGIHHSSSQFEFLADQTWSHFAYGKNAVHSRGHHGNAILSRFPIMSYENQDVSLNKYERRGLLHATIDVSIDPNKADLETPPTKKNRFEIHALSVHLNLREKDRALQIEKLSERISAMVPHDAPLILAGDFNDWRKSVTPVLARKQNLKEAFVEATGHHAKTFPSFFPLLPLDRIYFRNLKCTSVSVLKGGAWNEISDHLPILAELEITSS